MSKGLGVILSHQVFIKCKYAFVYSMCISVHLDCIWACVYASIHAASQEACALYWLSQNSSPPRCDCVFMCDGHF